MALLNKNLKKLSAIESHYFSNNIGSKIYSVACEIENITPEIGKIYNPKELCNNDPEFNKKVNNLAGHFSRMFLEKNLSTGQNIGYEVVTTHFYKEMLEFESTTREMFPISDPQDLRYDTGYYMTVSCFESLYKLIFKYHLDILKLDSFPDVQNMSIEERTKYIKDLSGKTILTIDHKMFFKEFIIFISSYLYILNLKHMNHTASASATTEIEVTCLNFRSSLNELLYSYYLNTILKYLLENDLLYVNNENFKYDSFISIKSSIFDENGANVFYLPSKDSSKEEAYPPFSFFDHPDCSVLPVVVLNALEMTNVVDNVRKIIFYEDNQVYHRIFYKLNNKFLLLIGKAFGDGGNDFLPKH